MPLNPEPIPVNEPLVRIKIKPGAPAVFAAFEKWANWFISDSWTKYFTTQSTDISASPSRVATVELSGQHASIATTSISGDLLSGLYRVTYYARITTPATTGAATSSLTMTFAWTDGGVSPTISGSAMTGNTTTTVQSGTILVRIDQGSPITYATTYASDTAGQMQYQLDIVLEDVAA